MYKVVLDENSYFTGNYCTIGDIPNSVSAEILPDCDRKYYKAYKGIPVEKQIEEEYTEMVDTEVEEEYTEMSSVTETIQAPIIDDDGNVTDEFEEKEVLRLIPVTKTRTVIKQVPETKTRLINVTVYEWELDEIRKVEIDNTPEPEKSKSEIEIMQEQIDALTEQNDMLTECLLEMSEVIYAE